MRSDEQRDKCIDVLITKVQALEAEVARLKGEPFSEESVATQSVPDVDTSRDVIFQKPEQNIYPKKPIDSSLENAIGTRWIGRIGGAGHHFWYGILS